MKRYTTRFITGLETVNHGDVPHVTFELMQTKRPLFASLSLTTGSVRRQSGRLLFDVARAADAGPTTRFRTIRVKGDGKCLFRSLALGLARNKGKLLSSQDEEQEADQLRLAVAEALCRTPKRRSDFKEALISVQAEDTLPNYCKRIMSPAFWGGEPELLVLSKMLQVPIFVYLPAEGSAGVTLLTKYGEQYTKEAKSHKRRKPVRLLFSSGNHYDLLVK